MVAGQTGKMISLATKTVVEEPEPRSELVPILLLSMVDLPAMVLLNKLCLAILKNVQVSSVQSLWDH